MFVQKIYNFMIIALRFGSFTLICNSGMFHFIIGFLLLEFLIPSPERIRKSIKYQMLAGKFIPLGNNPFDYFEIIHF